MVVLETPGFFLVLSPIAARRISWEASFLHSGPLKKKVIIPFIETHVWLLINNGYNPMYNQFWSLWG